ncbi:MULTISPECIES: hypothetical protein [Pseudomonadota]|uniref:hypothetical protein n=1 Tax=Pseudomonadota TaxID=1224 RepID=UPI0011B545BB|nr:MULTISPECIES: hypothetical protein [Pseudomonadota]MBY6319190.1 hypothetical protein [Alcaligenes faecalis]QPN91603.1 hypothetical protein IM703_18930 [Proteus vulgaris]QTO10687.1 hypothetical protein JEQ15_18970 [Proteus mirabilis]HEK2073667.1 hypothetical protein [Proteus mirabilis]
MKKEFLVLMSLLMISACSSSYERYSGVDQNLCDEFLRIAKDEYLSSKECFRKNIDKYINTGSNSEVVSVVRYECRDDIRKLSSAYLDRAYCSVAEDTYSSYRSVKSDLMDSRGSMLQAILTSVDERLLQYVMYYRANHELPN